MKTYTSEEMNKIKLKPGYWWENVAKLGSKPRWKMVKKPKGDE